MEIRTENPEGIKSLLKRAGFEFVGASLPPSQRTGHFYAGDRIYPVAFMSGRTFKTVNEEQPGYPELHKRIEEALDAEAGDKAR
jgi:hypothetical protein